MLCLVTKLCPTLCNPMDCSPPWGFSRQEYWSGLPCPPPGDLANPGTEPRSWALQVDSLPAEPKGKPKSSRVKGLLLLQQIFPTQEQKRGFLHPRRTLYQLSYEGSPDKPRPHIKKQRHFFTYKGPSSQSYAFSSSHIWM